MLHSEGHATRIATTILHQCATISSCVYISMYICVCLYSAIVLLKFRPILGPWKPMELCIDLLKGVMCTCCFSDCPRIQHSCGAVPRTGHLYWGDFCRLSLFTGRAAPYQDQRMRYGPSCPSEPHRDIWVWVRNLRLRYTDRLQFNECDLLTSSVVTGAVHGASVSIQALLFDRIIKYSSRFGFNSI